METNNIQLKFDLMEFNILLKKIRLYRGYKHQSAVSKQLGISRQVYSLWELGKRLPTIHQLVLLANFFRVGIQYFCTPGAEPGEYVWKGEEKSS